MKKRGVSLIELIIAIAILTMVVFAAGGILLTGWKMFRGSKYDAQAQRNAMLPLIHIQKTINESIRAENDNNNNRLICDIYTDITTLTTATVNYYYDGTNMHIVCDDGINNITRRFQNINSFTFQVGHSGTDNTGTVVDVEIVATDNDVQSTHYKTHATTHTRAGAALPIN